MLGTVLSDSYNAVTLLAYPQLHKQPMHQLHSNHFTSICRHLPTPAVCRLAKTCRRMRQILHQSIVESYTRPPTLEEIHILLSLLDRTGKGLVLSFYISQKVITVKSNFRGYTINSYTPNTADKCLDVKEINCSLITTVPQSCPSIVTMCFTLFIRRPPKYLLPLCYATILRQNQPILDAYSSALNRDGFEPIVYLFEQWIKEDAESRLLPSIYSSKSCADNVSTALTRKLAGFFDDNTMELDVICCFLTQMEQSGEPFYAAVADTETRVAVVERKQAYSTPEIAIHYTKSGDRLRVENITQLYNALFDLREEGIEYALDSVTLTSILSNYLPIDTINRYTRYNGHFMSRHFADVFERPFTDEEVNDKELRRRRILKRYQFLNLWAQYATPFDTEAIPSTKLQEELDSVYRHYVEWSNALEF